MYNFKKGFGILEIILAIAIVVILAAISLPSFERMRQEQVLKTAVADLVSAVDKAKSQTLSSVNSLEYGVHFESNKIVVFEGNLYSSSDPSNEDMLISSPVTISDISLTGGATELYFDKLSGEPSKNGTVTISNSSISKTITISPTGAVSTN